MNTTQIDCFLQAAKERSFSQAAQKLYMTQPTFGRQISALEQELGVPLFTRGSSSTTLTEEGQILYKGFSAMKEQYTQLVHGAQKLYHGHGGHFAFGLLEGQLLDERTSEMLWQFRQKYPTIQFSVSHYSFRAMADALINRELDIGLTLTKDAAERPELDCRELYVFPNELVVHKATRWPKQRTCPYPIFPGMCSSRWRTLNPALSHP